MDVSYEIWRDYGVPSDAGEKFLLAWVPVSGMREVYWRISVIADNHMVDAKKKDRPKVCFFVK